jgi:short-subunit dehydrogenase
MSSATGTSPIQPELGLLGQTVVVIGGTSGIGLETARRAPAEGARLILAARSPEHLEHASRELGTLSTAARTTPRDTPDPPRGRPSWTSPP